MGAEDSGFAIKGWTAVRFENTEVITSGTKAMAMGNYYFTNQNGETKVEYTFGYFLDSEETLRINAHHSALPYPPQVTEAMVTAAQKAWGDGIVAISKSYTDNEDYEAKAREHIKNLYGYDQGLVLFKPTLAADEQFRGTFDGAVSYFVAKNAQAPNTVISEDSGFAIKGWTAVRFENTEVITSGSTATAMGNYFFTNSAGETKVEYTFGYFLDAAGNLRINAHHSALPYASQVTLAKVTAAQKAWGDGIVAISKSYTDGGDYEQVARDHISNLYGYAEGVVLFKPTLAADQQFRGTFDGALSYFVAKNTQAPTTVISEDSGFAIKGWTAVRFENTEVITSGSTAMA